VRLWTHLASKQPALSRRERQTTDLQRSDAHPTASRVAVFKPMFRNSQFVAGFDVIPPACILTSMLAFSLSTPPRLHPPPAGTPAGGPAKRRGAPPSAWSAFHVVDAMKVARPG
jgi:hypothetical protein